MVIVACSITGLTVSTREATPISPPRSFIETIDSTSPITIRYWIGAAMTACDLAKISSAVISGAAPVVAAEAMSSA